VLIRKVSEATLHLLAGSNDRGLVFFCCEQEPLLTLRSYGVPSRCPICQQSDPISSELGKNPAAEKTVNGERTQAASLPRRSEGSEEG
jgi:hypothetical protein